MSGKLGGPGENFNIISLVIQFRLFAKVIFLHRTNSTKVSWRIALT